MSDIRADRAGHFTSLAIVIRLAWPLLST